MNNLFDIAGNSSTEQKTEENIPVLEQGDDVIELGEDFDFEGFQVVRREFFAHLREPAVSFSDCKFSVSAACIAKFPQTEYIQVLVNSRTKTLVLRPSREGERDSYLWTTATHGKKKPKAITCRLFYAKVCDLMDWNPNYRYKMLGRLIHANNEYLLAFDLTAAEVYQRTALDDGTVRKSKTAVYPAGWQNQFGLPYSEHKQSMQVNLFDGYAVISIREQSIPARNAISEKA